MKKAKKLIGVLLIIMLCGCQSQHYNYEEVDKYLKEKYSKKDYEINKEFIEEEYDRAGNTQRKYEVKNKGTGEQCYVFSTEYYREHTSYEISDNCENVLK